jgi:hypothetical protein
MFDWLVKSAYAQVTIQKYFDPSQRVNSLGALVNIITRNALTIAGLVTFFGVILAGIRYIQHSGSGDAKQLDNDKGAFTAAIVGLMIVFGAYYFIRIVSTITGFNFLDPVK